MRWLQARAAPASANPPADPVGLGNGRLAAVVENLAEHQIVDRRPAPISLCDPRAVDICSHAPALKFYPRIASTNGCGRAAPFAAVLFAVALWMNPPPSTRAWPKGAS